MALDPTRLRSLREALNKSEDLILAFQGQTGALNKAQSESAAQLRKAAATRDAAIAKAQAAYDLVEVDARKIREAEQAKATGAYNTVAKTQEARINEAAKALAEAEAALRNLQDSIRDEFGYNTNLFPTAGAVGSAIRIG